MSREESKKKSSRRRKNYDKIKFQLRASGNSHTQAYSSMFYNSSSKSKTLNLSSKIDLQNSRSYSLDKDDKITEFGAEVSEIKRKDEVIDQKNQSKFPSLAKIALNSFSTRDYEKSNYTPMKVRSKELFLNLSQTPKPRHGRRSRLKTRDPKSTKRKKNNSLVEFSSKCFADNKKNFQLEQMQRALRMERKVREERLRMLKDRIAHPGQLIESGGVPELRFLAKSVNKYKKVDIETQQSQRRNVSFDEKILEDIEEGDQSSGRIEHNSEFLTEQRMNQTTRTNTNLRVTDQGFRVKMILGRKLIKNKKRGQKNIKSYQKFRNFGRKKALMTFSSYQKNYKNILKKIKENGFTMKLPPNVRETHQTFNEFYYVSDEELVFPLRALRDVEHKPPQLFKDMAMKKMKKEQQERLKRLEEDRKNRKILKAELERKLKQRIIERIKKSRRGKFKVRSSKLLKPNWASLYDGPEEFEAYLMDMPNEFSLEELNPDIHLKGGYMIQPRKKRPKYPLEDKLKKMYHNRDKDKYGPKSPYFTIIDGQMTYHSHWMDCVRKLLREDNVFENPDEIGYYEILKEDKRNKNTQYKQRDIDKERKEKPYIPPKSNPEFEKPGAYQSAQYFSMFSLYEKLDSDIYEDSLRLEACLHSAKSYKTFAQDRKSYYMNL